MRSLQIVRRGSPLTGFDGINKLGPVIECHRSYVKLGTVDENSRGSTDSFACRVLPHFAESVISCKVRVRVTSQELFRVKLRILQVLSNQRSPVLLEVSLG